MKTKSSLLITSTLFLLVWNQASFSQNVVENDELDLKLPPVKLSASELEHILNKLPGKKNFIPAGEAERIQRKLEKHIINMIENWQLMPFHHTLGISGYEVYFNHPDELFYSISIALPYLSKETKERADKFLKEQFKVLPPYSLEGYDNRVGKPRESYDVPFGLRIKGKGFARSAFGIYAFWSWCYFTENYEPLKVHYSEIKSIVKPLIETEYRFDIYKTDYSKDEAEKLNGDLAGLIGFIRMARLNKDSELENSAIQKATELLNLRVNLERVNPGILTKTSATKSLHINKLARYCDIIPEIAEALRNYCDGVSEKRLYAFRSARNGWHLAFGDRMIGGENYTNPLHFGRAMFSGAALIERLDPTTLASFVDVPHCAGDFYFIEKCALVLRAFAENN